MKALVLKETGFGLENVEMPVISGEEVLVKVHYAALNHRDQWIREGMYAKIQLPAILGSDGMGVVSEVADKKNNSWLDKKVIINPNNSWGSNPDVQDKSYHILGMPTFGTFSEYVKVPVDRLIEKPAYLKDEEAAALPLGGLTAYNALFNKGLASAGKNVLVSGVGGGVAQFAFLFAKAAGANVWVSSSKDFVLEECKTLGAKGMINYTDPEAIKNASRECGGFDLIIDSAGGDQMNTLLASLKPGGRLVFYGATLGVPSNLNLRTVFWNQLSLLGSTMGSDEDFTKMIDFCKNHQIEPIIDKVFDFENIVTAFDRMKAGKQFGKIVVKII